MTAGHQSWRTLFFLAPCPVSVSLSVLSLLPSCLSLCLSFPLSVLSIPVSVFPSASVFSLSLLCLCLCLCPVPFLSPRPSGKLLCYLFFPCVSHLCQLVPWPLCLTCVFLPAPPPAVAAVGAATPAAAAAAVGRTVAVGVWAFLLLCPRQRPPAPSLVRAALLSH